MSLSNAAHDDGARGLDAVRAARDAVARASAVLLDWDGCIAVNDRPRPAAVQFMSEWRDRVAVVSNNTTHLPEDFVHILARSGVHVRPERIILAGVETLARAREIGAPRVMVIGDNRLKAHGRNQGLNLVQDEAELIVLLRDPRFTYAKLERAANGLRAGARLLVANPDLTHPGANGRVTPETGALLAALMACVDPREVEAEIVGKPSPRLFERACRSLRMAPERAVMIGDNPATDIAGASALGLPSLLVGPRSKVMFEDLLATANGAVPPLAASR